MFMNQTAFYIIYFIIAFLMYVLMDKTIYDVKHEMLAVKFFTIVVMALIWPVIIVMTIILVLSGPLRKGDQNGGE